MQKKIVAIIEARMGSTRYPGKVLKKINGKTILQILIERIKLSKKINQVVVATTRSKKDDAIVKFCKNYSYNYYRGSETDVLDRVCKTSKFYKASHILQLTGDNPLADFKVIDHIIKYYFQNNYDYITNNGFGDIKNRKIPIGMDAQFFSASKLNYINRLKLNKIYREHPSLFFYKNKRNTFKIKNIPIPKKWISKINIRLTLDTKYDFILIKKIMKNFKYQVYFSIEDIIKLIRNYPHLAKINSQVLQKKVNL